MAEDCKKDTQIEQLKAEVTRQQATIVRQKKLIRAQERLVKTHVDLFKIMHGTLDRRISGLVRDMARIDQLEKEEEKS